MGRDPKGVVSSTASGPVDIPPPAPEPPRRRAADTRGNTLHTIERRMEEIDARLTLLEARMDAPAGWRQAHLAQAHAPRWTRLRRWWRGEG